jgi:hypothetical protein
MTNYKALAVFFEQTVCIAGILLSIVSLLLHLGRPYFERVRSRVSLRVVADVFWVFYTLLRDGTLFVSVLCGISHLNLDVMADITVGMPFVPFGTLLLAGALFCKAFYNCEEVTRAFRVANGLVMLGALSNVFGYVFVMEAPGEEYAESHRRFWEIMTWLQSNGNHSIAAFLFSLTIIPLLTLGLIACLRFMHVIKPAQRPESSSRPAHADVPAGKMVENV